MTEATLLSWYSKERIDVVVATIDGMLSQSFPQDSAILLLRSYSKELKTQHGIINNLHVGKAPDKDVLQTCRVVLSKVDQLMPRLGVLQRSSSLRIAFELAKSIQRLATELLHSDEDLKNSIGFNVLCASEWNYSPLYYRKHDLLQEMVLFGLPAAESDNSLLCPIMAHEAGHAFWAYSKTKDGLRKRIEQQFRTIVFDNWDQLYANGLTAGFPKPQNVLDLQTDVHYSGITTFLSGSVYRQAEETFCDYVGLCTFGASFLSAFAYLDASGARDVYSETYCSGATRSSLLVCAAKELSIPVPQCFSLAYDVEARATQYPYTNTTIEQELGKTSHLALIASMLGELSVIGIAKEILDFASEKVNAAGLTAPTPDRISKARRFLELDVPTPPKFNPQETLCAAWELLDERRSKLGDFGKPKMTKEWKEYLRFSSILKEVVAKSLEIRELES